MLANNFNSMEWSNNCTQFQYFSRSFSHLLNLAVHTIGPGPSVDKLQDFLVAIYIRFIYWLYGVPTHYHHRWHDHLWYVLLSQSWRILSMPIIISFFIIYGNIFRTALNVTLLHHIILLTEMGMSYEYSWIRFSIGVTYELRSSLLLID